MHPRFFNINLVEKSNKSQKAFVVKKAPTEEERSSCKSKKMLLILTKKRTKSVWYSKKAPLKRRAIFELISQEIFRLFLSDHTKTRLITDLDTTRVISKSLPKQKQFKTIHSFPDFYEGVKTGKYNGLGGILVVSLFVEDCDRRIENILLLENQLLSSIDGDFSFASTLNNLYQITINEKTIAALPGLPPDAKTHNWLGERMSGKKFFTSLLEEKYESILNTHRKNISPEDYINSQKNKIEEYDKEISNLDSFRNGVNGVNPTLLEIILMPEALLKTLVYSYTEPSESTDIPLGILIKNQLSLKQAALQNESFLSYIKNNSADIHVSAFIDKLKSFKTTSKNHLFNEKEAEKNERYLMEIKQGLQELKRIADELSQNNNQIAPSETASHAEEYTSPKPF